MTVGQRLMLQLLVLSAGSFTAAVLFMKADYPGPASVAWAVGVLSQGIGAIGAYVESKRGGPSSE